MTSPPSPQEDSVGRTLLDTDVEASLRQSVASFLGRSCTPESLTAMYDGQPGPAQVVWSGLARELGLAALLVPEEHGGAGVGAREAAVVMEEMGRRCAPGPFLTSAVLATTAILSAGASSRQAELLPQLASGERIAALVLPFGSAPGTWPTTTDVDSEGRISGRVLSVAGAVAADCLVLPVLLGDLPQLCLVDARATGVRVEPVVSLDMTRPVADVFLDDAEGLLLAEGTATQDAVAGALLVGAALLASEQVGVARWCLETTCGYLSQRRQFGRIVGGYQALKHRLAQLFVQIESADATARYAAVQAAAAASPSTSPSGCGEARREAAIAAYTAQAFCADVAVHAAEVAIQLHGGIGMTWEYPAHLYLKRAKADQLALGTPDRHRAALAALVDIPAPSGEMELRAGQRST